MVRSWGVQILKHTCDGPNFQIRRFIKFDQEFWFHIRQFFIDLFQCALKHIWRSKHCFIAFFFYHIYPKYSDRANTVDQDQTVPKLYAQQASYLEGGPLMWILPLYLHINQKSVDDDDMFLICVEVLRPRNPMGSCWARSVYLTTYLLGRLSPLSG